VPVTVATNDRWAKELPGYRTEIRSRGAARFGTHGALRPRQRMSRSPVLLFQPADRARSDTDMSIPKPYRSIWPDT